MASAAHALSAQIVNTFESLQGAWRTSLWTLSKTGSRIPGVEDPTSVGSCFGEAVRDTWEVMGTSFSISSPRMRIINCPVYSMNLSFAIANVIWVLTGSNDVDMISFYNPRGRQFSDDGSTINSAPGYRIFSGEKESQFERVIEILKKDPSSRRAFFQIALASDLLEATKDVSCVFNLQFFIRQNSLHCLTHMRSQSAFRVMPYDIFLFTMLQEAVAISLGLELGTYFHLCGSLHFYEDESPYVSKVLSSHISKIPSMELMTSCDGRTRIKLKEAEEKIRISLKKDLNVCVNFENFGLDDYWTKLLKLMVHDFRQRHLRSKAQAHGENKPIVRIASA